MNTPIFKIMNNIYNDNYIIHPDQCKWINWLILINNIIIFNLIPKLSITLNCLPDTIKKII